MTRKRPDWKKLGEIANRAAALKKAGSLNYAKWRALVDEADAACNGDPQESDILAKYAEREWIDRLTAEDRSSRVA